MRPVGGSLGGIAACSLAIAILLVRPISANASGPNVGTGADGPLSVSSTAVVNVYTMASGAAGTSSLTVGSTTGFAPGDEVLVHQTQGSGAGNTEYARLASIGSGALTLSAPLTSSYAGKAQVVRVPNYTDVTVQSGGTLTAKPWDGSSGGILAFRATGAVNIRAGGRIALDGAGFRGGPGGGSQDNTTATQGEGYPGLGLLSTAANGSGGGASHAGGGESPSAGGGYGKRGLVGTGPNCCQYPSQAQGGEEVGDPAITSLFFGGGGGGGHGVNDPGRPAGGAGAGAALITATSITVDGNISARGLDGQTGTSTGGSHGGAGGAGGAILLKAGTVLLGNNQVVATGGVGGSGTYSTGGSGAIGRIRVEYCTTLSGFTTPVASVQSCTPQPAAQAPDFGNGQDGDITITGPRDLNPVRAQASGLAGATTLSVSNVTGGGFLAGQAILIHQTRGAGVGAWELNHVQSVAAGQLTLQSPLAHTYTTDGGASRAQVLWVPQFANVTVGAGAVVFPAPWDGNVGGITAFLVSQTTSISGTVAANGSAGVRGCEGQNGCRVPGATGPGFHGGDGQTGSPAIQAWTGEGANGPILQQQSDNSNGGGGGSSVAAPGGSPGGSGSHATVGSSGIGGVNGVNGIGATSIVGSADLTTMVFGGGGGGAAREQSNSVASGGSGAGIVFIASKNVQVTGAVAANGGNGGPDQAASGRNYGGAGAGGSILIRTDAGSLGNGAITARGGSVDTSQGGGGSGGDGRIRVEYCTSIAGSTVPAASVQQLTCTAPNSPPTDIALSTASVDENSPVGTPVGAFSTTDPDVGDTFTYSLVSGLGGADNTAFTIDGRSLKTNAVFDYETKSSYSIRVRSTDQGGFFVEKSFTISVRDVPENPAVMPSVEQSALEGTSHLFDLGSFADPDGGPWSVDVDWGDGSSHDVFSIATVGPLGSRSHTYADNKPNNAPYTVTVRVTDSTSLWDQKTFQAMVSNVPPAVASPQVAPEPSSEGGAVTASATFADPAGPLDAPFSCTVNYGDGSGSLVGTVNGTSCTGPSHTYVDNKPNDAAYIVTVSVTDKDKGTGSASTNQMVKNVSPTVGPITAPSDPVKIGTNVAASASFTDPGVEDTHTATWDWGDGTTSAATVTESNGSGAAAGSHVYSAPGLYVVNLTVVDKDGGQGQSPPFQYVVVYDPAAGFVTGAGWFNSPPGAYTPNPGLIGKVIVSFTAKYQQGAATPAGHTNLRFAVANLIFQSSSYDWLVISGAKAQHKGTGTINGSGSYGFILTVIDGDLRGRGGGDKLRIKIWDKTKSADGSAGVVYDNQIGAPDTTDPVTLLGAGSITIHKP